MKERYPRATFTQQAGLVAARVAAEKGQYDAASASLAWVADQAARTSTARSRACASPASCSTRRSTTRRSSSSTPSTAGRVRGARRRPARRHPADPGQERRGAGRVPEGVDGDGSEARLSPPRRGQAERCSACSRQRQRRAASRRPSDRCRPRRGAAARARSSLARRWRRPARRLLARSARCSAPDKPKPKELEPIVAPITVRPVWNQSIGAVQFPLTVAVNGNVLTLAASDGTVLAVEADSGRALWRANVGAKISAGVGSDGSTAAVVTRDGELVALEAGTVKWKKPLGVRVATAPLVAGGRIFVLGVDRTVQAFDASDGIKLWQVQRPGDPLTLSQTGVITAFKNTLVVGQGPRMAGIDPARRRRCAGRCRSARRAAPTRSSASPTCRPGRAQRRSALRALVPGGGRLRRRAARQRRLDQDDRRHRRDRRRRRAALRRRRVRPAQRLAHGDRRRRLDLGVADVPRPRRAGGDRRVGRLRRCERHAALVLARQGRIAGARPDRRQRDRRRRR